MKKDVKLDKDRVKKEIIKSGQILFENRLVVGPGGNISFRTGNLFYITPSGKGFDELKEENIIGIEINSKEIVEGEGVPSSEVAMHRDVYIARGDIRCIIHTHPPITIAIIGAGAKIKPLYPDAALLPGDKIPIIDYVTVCTQELAVRVKEVITDYDVVLLKKHGLITVGNSLKEATIRSLMVEETAKMTIAARSIGKEAVMTGKEIKEMNNLEIEKYRRKLIKGSK